ncbi:MAG: hypothetical protein OEW75_19300 [Cyclobacteriaceae bacterium]|nr:hypothetical protein [Cyclobacteriaceae bacterium]
MKYLLIIFFPIVLLSSCLSTMVHVNTIYTNGLPIDTINLVSTMMGPVWQPVFPLLDAAGFNPKTNRLADQIMDEEQKILSVYQEKLMTSFNKMLPAVTISGKDFTSEKAEKYRIKEGVQVENKNFPVVFFSEGDLNVLDLEKAKNINAIFKENEQIKLRISTLASALNVKTILVSYNRLSVISVGSFGITGNLRLESYLFLYSFKGDLLLDATGFTKPTTITGDNINQYKQQLDQFDQLVGLFNQELVKYIK